MLPPREEGHSTRLRAEDGRYGWRLRGMCGRITGLNVVYWATQEGRSIRNGRFRQKKASIFEEDDRGEKGDAAERGDSGVLLPNSFSQRSQPCLHLFVFRSLSNPSWLALFQSALPLRRPKEQLHPTTITSARAKHEASTYSSATIDQRPAP